ncbi:helix-turn-helix domain-containing protein [Actinoplanes sp. CA-142083]|uniref:helix-turn-helix domain-containing protein n=1 Tax=Actinoplanes sp. CA-142083 TaxID=3239903 RepID=UPI003D92C02D
MTALGEFLQARRARVTPAEAGVRTFGRRRVPGLRREELARLAGVSVQYLTRLEQGVDRHPSPQVLDALAAALRLDPDATAHLHALAAPGPGAPARATADADLQQLLDAWPGVPAYVRDRHFDVLLANKPAMLLAPLYHPGRNLVRDMFLDPAARELFPDWPEVAAQSVAALRATADLDDPATAALIAELRADDDFRRWWAHHDVRPTRDETKRFRHPDVGPLSLRRQSLAIAGSGFVMIAYQPEPGSASADALARLLGGR